METGAYRRSDSEILIDYYHGAYGPTIRIDINARASLQKLRDLFLQLGGPARETISALDIDKVRLTGFANLVLRFVPKRQPTERGLRLTAGEDSTAVFLWSLSDIEWRRCVGLVEGLLEAEQPGHQYLTEEGTDDAIVELAYRESC